MSIPKIYTIKTEHFIKYLIDNGILIPKRDDCLYLPSDIQLSINGNVGRIIPNPNTAQFYTYGSADPARRPEYDKSKVNNNQETYFHNTPAPPEESHEERKLFGKQKAADPDISKDIPDAFEAAAHRPKTFTPKAPSGPKGGGIF